MAYVWGLTHHRTISDSTFNWKRDLWIFSIQLVAAGATAIACVRLGTSNWLALTLGMAVILLLPVYHMVAWENYSNHSQLDQVRYVLNNSGRSDQVLDGFTGVGAFREQAFPYFLAYDVQRIVPKNERRDLERRLQDGSLRPELVILDWNLRDFLGNETVTEMRRDYVDGYRRPEYIPYEPELQLILKRR